MTEKESKHIDFVFTRANIAAIRDADTADILSAVVYDIDLIRKGKDPEEIKKLV